MTEISAPAPDAIRGASAAGDAGLGSGSLVAERFVLEQAAGSGGMGTVFRARDRKTDRLVALKVLHKNGGQLQDTARFLREAQVLAELRHPGIVAYVAHGHTEHGQPFLAMDWLEGEDLARRISRGGLRLTESLQLVSRVASALNMAHQHGIVHRDLKPSNLFLPGGDIERVTVLDFGIARRVLASSFGPMTQTGVVIGTPEYMAPEQARGQHDIGPSADVFSLGCVLFECLTGQPPFRGEHIAAVLAKILFDEVPRLRELRPELPERLEALIEHMLAKDPRRRPRDAGVLLNALAALGTLPDVEAPVATRTPSLASLQSGEQQLVSVVLAADACLLPEQATLDANLDQAGRKRFESLRAALTMHGSHAERLADGSIVTTLVSGQNGTATDQAAQAARCALLVHERWPEATVALTTGRGVLADDGQLPLGEAIDRAARLLRLRGGLRTPGVPPSSASLPLHERIVIDDVTAGLLDGRFELSRHASGSYTLVSERVSVDESRPLLGRPTPCVGREQELATLDAVLHGCIEESVARAVLVVAPSGVGKSRLRHEFLRRVGTRAEGIQICMARGDRMSAGTSYALIGQAVRRLCGVLEGAPPAAQVEQLTQRVARNLEPADLPRVAAFLGELASVPFPDDNLPQLRAARRDPKLLSEQVSQALCEFLCAECAASPVLLILEDLHWGDSPSTRLIEAALRAASELPLMVLALGRPEVEERFPKLWKDRGLQEIRLGGLSRRASERLVHLVLGKNTPPETVHRILEQSAGNALYLEELIRAVSEGKGDELPETVLAMLQARLARLDATARRVLRAASVFGDVFWRGGVLSLLGHEHGSQAIDSWFQALLEAEVIEPHRESRFPGDPEFAFRHGLLREAAYSLLTVADQKLGHKLAARYLELRHEPDPHVLAQHYERAEEADRAVDYYVAAAEQAFRRGDLTEAQQRSERALGLGPAGEALGRLHAVQASLYFFRADYARALEAAREAVHLLPRGSTHFYLAHYTLLSVSLNTGDLAMMRELLSDFAATKPAPDALPAFVTASGFVVMIYTFLGMPTQARAFLRDMEERGSAAFRSDPQARAWYLRAEASFQELLGDDPWWTRVVTEESIESFAQAGDVHGAALSRLDRAFADIFLGRFEEAEAAMRVELARARAEESWRIQQGACFLAMVLALSGKPEKLDEAQALAERHLATTMSNPLMRALLASMLGHVHMLRGRYEEAERTLRLGDAQSRQMPGVRPLLLSFLIPTLLHAGKRDDARVLLREAEQLLAQLGHAGVVEIRLRVACAEAHAELGDDTAARAALHQAITEVFARAAKIPDPDIRASFLYELWENRRAIELSQSWSTPRTA